MKTKLNGMLGRAMPAMLVIAAIAVAGALALNVAPHLMREADAAVTNYPPGVQVNAMPIQISGTYTTSPVTPVRFNLPYAGRLIGFSASARTVSGTITVDLQAAGVSLLSPVVTLLSSGVPVAGTVNTSSVSDEAELTVVLSSSGAGPSVTDVTVLPTFLRR